MRDKLIARRDKAEASFNQLVKQREAKVAEVTELDAELNRLQGEYRMANELLDKADKKDAATIDVTETEGS